MTLLLLLGVSMCALVVGAQDDLNNESPAEFVSSIFPDDLEPLASQPTRIDRHGFVDDNAMVSTGGWFASPVRQGFVPNPPTVERRQSTTPDPCLVPIFPVVLRISKAKAWQKNATSYNDYARSQAGLKSAYLELIALITANIERSPLCEPSLRPSYRSAVNSILFPPEPLSSSLPRIVLFSVLLLASFAILIVGLIRTNIFKHERFILVMLCFLGFGCAMQVMYGVLILFPRGASPFSSAIVPLIVPLVFNRLSIILFAAAVSLFGLIWFDALNAFLFSPYDQALMRFWARFSVVAVTALAVAYSFSMVFVNYYSYDYVFDASLIMLFGLQVVLLGESFVV
jgi:hypothetical protein